MQKRVYGKALRTGWILTVIGLIGTVLGFNLGGSTGNTSFFALAALGVLLVISGVTTLGVYASMERGVSRALSASSPLLRYTLSAQDYAAYAAAEADEIRSTNKKSLIIALVFCGLLSVIGPFTVKDDGIIFVFIGVGLALFLLVSAWIITRYRVNDLKHSDWEVVLTSGGAFVGGKFHAWSAPSTFLISVAYSAAEEHAGSPLAVIRITYGALTRTLVTPYTILIPVPEGMEKRARAAAQALQTSVKA